MLYKLWAENRGPKRIKLGPFRGVRIPREEKDIWVNNLAKEAK